MERTSLFLMVPKLFSTFTQQGKDEEHSLSKSPRSKVDLSAEEIAKETAHLQKAEGLLYQYEVEQKDQHDAIDSCSDTKEGFFFKMMSSTDSEEMTRSPFFSNFPYEASLSPTNVAHQSWNKVRKEMALHNLVPLTANSLSKIIFEQRHQILRNPEKILRVNFRIESKSYQRNLHLKEIIFESVHPTSMKLQKFFRILAESVTRSSQLMQVLCISPEDLNTICSHHSLDKICKTQKKIAELKIMQKGSLHLATSPTPRRRTLVRVEHEESLQKQTENQESEVSDKDSGLMLDNEEPFEEDKIHIVPNSPHSFSRFPESMEIHPQNGIIT